MNLKYRQADITETSVHSDQGQTKRSAVRIPLSTATSLIEQFVVGLLWISAIVYVLYLTGVLKCLRSFDSSFRYLRGITPLTTPSTVAKIILGYVVSLPILKYIMKNRKPLSFPKVITVHNMFLMMSSAFLAIGISIFVVKDIFHNGFHHSVCSAETHNNGYLHMLYYLNHLLKYYEFIDTYIIVLKKRKLIFLHWYHHGITALLTYIQQNDYTPVQWVPILMNLTVHVVMYSYYLLSSWHINVWWKKYLTIFQIVQFVIDLTVCGYCALQLGKVPMTCDGTKLAAFSGLGIIGSYFFLFLNFYVKNYNNKDKTD